MWNAMPPGGFVPGASGATPFQIVPPPTVYRPANVKPYVPPPSSPIDLQVSPPAPSPEPTLVTPVVTTAADPLAATPVKDAPDKDAPSGIMEAGFLTSKNLSIFLASSLVLAGIGYYLNRKKG